MNTNELLKDMDDFKSHMSARAQKLSMEYGCTCRTVVSEVLPVVYSYTLSRRVDFSSRGRSDDLEACEKFFVLLAQSVFSGGILGDPIGMGKALSIIVLILAKPRDRSEGLPLISYLCFLFFYLSVPSLHLFQSHTWIEQDCSLFPVP